MQLEEFPLWWPEQPPIYDIHKTYFENAEKGPFFAGSIPKRTYPPKDAWINFLGYSVATPLGVPAGPLLNSRWVEFAANMGFDVVTYKTIRSQAHPAHPLPNMIYVDSERMLQKEDQSGSIFTAKNPPKEVGQLSATNSFGIPSRDPNYLLTDIRKAKNSLHEGQVLIVSIVGTPREGEDFEQDFVVASQIATEGGADILEIDLSCPNVKTCEGSLFTSPEFVYKLSVKIKKCIPLPLIIKVGVVPDREILKSVMIAAAKAGVEAICGINTLSMNVMKDDGLPALGKERSKAGVCGGLIRNVALEFTSWASSINREESLGLVIMSTGGVTIPSHFDLFFERGADIAMSAIGMMWDPYLALRYSRLKSK